MNNARIASLDGIRAFAIGCVLLLHISQGTRWNIWLIPDGVSIFFVLSGFLITSLMLREWNRTGEVNLRDFYLRRLYRICPPLYTYILVSSLLCLLLGKNIGLTANLQAALFLKDYLNLLPGPLGSSAGGWLTEHMWSLSVEEQFYLLYPALFVFVYRRFGRAPLAKVTLALLTLAPLMRIAGRSLSIFRHQESYMLHTRMDSLMVGCLIALCVALPRFEALYRKASKIIWVFPLYALVIDPYISHRYGIMFQHSIGYTITAICVGVTILWCTRNPKSPAGLVLNCGPVATVGILSYSIYLWQTFFLHPESPLMKGAYNHVGYKLVMIALFASMSYRLVEQPFLSLRKRTNPLPPTAPALPTFLPPIEVNADLSVSPVC